VFHPIYLLKIKGVETRDRPIFGFYWYISIGQNSWFYQPQQVLIKHCYIPHARRQLVPKSTMNQVKTTILQQC